MRFTYGKEVRVSTILQGPRSHDDRVTARGTITSVLTLPPRAPADTTDHDQDQDERADDGEEAAPATDDWDNEDDDEGDEETDAAPGITGSSTTPLLRFSLPREDVQSIALFLRTCVLRPESEIWLTGYQMLRTWVREHGHARVPRDTTVELTDGRVFGLGQWVFRQRRAFREGTLRPWRYDLLTETGMNWEVADAGFWRVVTAARTAFETYRTLALPRSLVIDGVRIGQKLTNLRRPSGLGSDPVRADERRRALEAIDPEWCPPWPRALVTLAAGRPRGPQTVIMAGDSVRTPRHPLPQAVGDRVSTAHSAAARHTSAASSSIWVRCTSVASSFRRATAWRSPARAASISWSVRKRIRSRYVRSWRPSSASATNAAARSESPLWKASWACRKRNSWRCRGGPAKSRTGSTAVRRACARSSRGGRLWRQSEAAPSRSRIQRVMSSRLSRASIALSR
ncbi:helicase associated domain-containing protein [Streptomyces californicus]